MINEAEFKLISNELTLCFSIVDGNHKTLTVMADDADECLFLTSRRQRMAVKCTAVLSLNDEAPWGRPVNVGT